MKSKRKIKLSFIISIIFLFFFTVISSFLFIISLKPLKINFLDYFDRESKIFNKIKVEEIGDIFLSFNKVTKNFELLIEDLVYENSYFPNILITLDPTFDKQIFNKSLKIFDGDIKIILPGKPQNKEDNFLEIERFKSNFEFLKNFSNIQIANTKVKLKINDENIKKYSIDLNYNNEELYLSVSEMNIFENFLSLNVSIKDEANEISLELRKFNFDFVKHIFDFESISFNNLNLSGSSKFLINNDRQIDEMIFNLILTGNFKYPTYNGFENVSFKNSKIFGEKNQDFIDIILDLKHKKSQIKFVLRFDPKQNNPITFLVNVEEINVNELLYLWPIDFKESVYVWMKNNSEGQIFNALLSLNIFKKDGAFFVENLKGKFDFNNTKIRYMESMPVIENIYGFAKIKNDELIFTINSGQSQNLNIKNGTVKLKDLDTDSENADILLEISSRNQDVINYLDNSPINKKNFSKLRNIKGDTTVYLNLMFPLLVDLPTEKIIYNSNVTITDSIFEDILNNYDLNDFYLNIEINNSKVLYNGGGKIFNSYTEFNGEQTNIKEGFKGEIIGKYTIKPSFSEHFFPNGDLIIKGNAEISYNILENNNGFSKIEGLGNLENLNLKSDFLGPNLDFNNGKLRFLIRPYDNSFSGFADVKTRNLNLEVNSIFNLSKIIELDVQTFKSPKQDFNLKYESENNKFLMNANKLSLNSIDIFEEDDFEIDNIELDLKINDFKIGDMNFSNSTIYAKKLNNFFEKINVNFVGENDFHMLSIKDRGADKEFILESNYIPGLLNILDLDFNINKGSIKIEGLKKENSGKYEGAIAGKNIVFFDAPFLANFFSIFSLDGFAQKLKDGGIIFNNFNADYKLENDKFKIVDSLLKGSELGIQFDSVIGLNDDYFLMNGSIIPAYTINTLITKFPIVGDIVTAGSPEDGLIGAKFKVEKIDGEYEIFYNPISVFVPNIIKNFLGD